MSSSKGVNMGKGEGVASDSKWESLQLHFEVWKMAHYIFEYH